MLRSVVTSIAESFPLVVLNAMILATAAHLLKNSTQILEDEFGSKPPSDSHLGYDPSEFHEVIDDMWGVEGCNAYLGTVTYKALYLLSVSTMLPAMLMRMLLKRQWTATAEQVPQLGMVLLFSQSFETSVECMACLKTLEPFPFVLVVVADLCNKMKVISMSLGVLGIVTLIILQSYLWPTMLLTGKQSKKKSSKTK
mmetsp:Transcript_16706/g.25231  ORF Transcript_16706/g.25231 Transcript_16706/m.25231 type:complete len:197 (-) Transcript_16706:137-727(-)